MNKPQIILGIESSCDETAAAVVQKQGDRVIILSNVVASSAQLQAKYGGVIPEQAAREQIKSIIPVIETAINDSRLMINDLNAIAVTYGPGLIGSLLVGVETAKVLATVWQKPLIPINHLIGHFYANWISKPSAISYQLSDKKQRRSDDRRLTTDDYPKFPCIGLLVSGGHTDLLLFKAHNKYEYLGGTRDDSAGECFDKCARLLGLPYPGGPQIAKLAKSGNPQAFDLPRPMINSKDFDFSFSGLKTSVANLLKEAKFESVKNKISNELTNLTASIEQAIIDVLITKTIRAAQTYHIDQIMIAGGVAANQKLQNDLRFKIDDLRMKAKLHVPTAELCTDNAAMIASAAFFNYQPTDPQILQANPNLDLSD